VQEAQEAQEVQVKHDRAFPCALAQHLCYSFVMNNNCLLPQLRFFVPEQIAGCTFRVFDLSVIAIPASYHTVAFDVPD
jgi:hypothetical protein